MIIPKYIPGETALKTIAAIMECNPLHRGHEYFLKEARRQSGADFVIALMSGDYVQRGEPAVWNKFVRAEALLLAGADLVLELPVCFAAGSAAVFAQGAVSILDRLKVVDELWFGSEAGQITLFEELSSVLTSEPAAYSALLKDELKTGVPFPAARSAALTEYLLRDSFCPGENAVCSGPGDAAASLAGFLDAPNNILGLEYCLALKKRDSRIRPRTLRRLGSGYRETALANCGSNSGGDPVFCSASAIRRALAEKKTETLSSVFPDFFVHDSARFQTDRLFCRFLTPDDFSLLLRYRLLAESAESLTRYQDVSADLARRIKNCENRFRGFTQFALLLKSRNHTYTHISRALLHIVLGLTDTDAAAAAGQNAVRVLGIGACKDLLHAIRTRSALSLAAGFADLRGWYDKDLFVSNLYESVFAAKYEAEFVHEYSRKLLRNSSER